MAAKKKSTATGTKPETKQETPTNEKTAQDNSSNYGNDAMVSLGGLWLNRDKNGQIYFSGYLGNAKMFIFKNKKKTKDNQPDYYMQIANNNKDKNKSASADDLENEISDTSDNDDIPF